MEEISFYGHPNVRATHSRTIEITKASNLTPRGDCIIGVNASKACHDLPDALKRRLQEDSVVRISIVVDGKEYNLMASGSSSLILTDRHDIVIRKSSYVCPRTLAVRSNIACNNLPKDMVAILLDPTKKGYLRIGVE